MEIVKFHRFELDEMQLRVRKDCPYLYTIEAANVLSLWNIHYDKDDMVMLDQIISICYDITWNDHNQLIRVVWNKLPDDNFDVSIIASGLWVGEDQSFAKIDQIGEFMKNLAVLRSFLSAL